MGKEFKKANDLKPVLFNQGFVGDFVVYEVERNKESKNGLRKDITLIHPQLLGEEFPKTFGHYHKHNDSELYEVLEGKVLFLCQKHSDSSLEIEQVYLIKAEKGDKIVILPGFSMTTINYGQSDALISNWVNNQIENDYGLFSQNQGACYYILKGENDNFLVIKNNHYQKVPELTQLKVKELPRELEDLNFLVSPEKYQNLLKVDNLYEKLN